MDGRSARAAGTGGKQRAAGRNKRLGRWRGHGVRGAQVQARLGRRTGGKTGKPTVQIEPKSRSANLARNNNMPNNNAPVPWILKRIVIWQLSPSRLQVCFNWIRSWPWSRSQAETFASRPRPLETGLGCSGDPILWCRDRRSNWVPLTVPLFLGW